MRTFTVISILCLPRTYSLRVEGGEGGGTAVKNVGLAPEDRAGDTISENLELGPSWNPVLAKELPEYIAADDMQSTHQEQTAKSVPKRLTKKEEAMEMMKGKKRGGATLNFRIWVQGRAQRIHGL